MIGNQNLQFTNASQPNDPFDCHPKLLDYFIAAISLVLSVLSYLKSRKIERQQYELNEHALKKIREKEADAKYAKLTMIKVSMISDVEIKMRIENHGKCDADYVRYKIVNESLMQQPKGMWLDGVMPDRIRSSKTNTIIKRYGNKTLGSNDK